MVELAVKARSRSSIQIAVEDGVSVNENIKKKTSKKKSVVLATRITGLFGNCSQTDKFARSCTPWNLPVPSTFAFKIVRVVCCVNVSKLRVTHLLPGQINHVKRQTKKMCQLRFRSKMY